MFGLTPHRQLVLGFMLRRFTPAGLVGPRSRNVRFGSKADICSAKRHVRFTPKSGHVRCNLGCPLWANSGHQAVHSSSRSITIACKGSRQLRCHLGACAPAVESIALWYRRYLRIGRNGTARFENYFNNTRYKSQSDSCNRTYDRKIKTNRTISQEPTRGCRPTILGYRSSNQACRSHRCRSASSPSLSTPT